MTIALGLDAASAQQGPPPPPVGIVTVQLEAIPITNELPGRIAPTRIAQVRPRVSGIIVARVFQQGSLVKAGDVLYRIDPEPFRVEVQRSQATLQRAEATRLLAQQQNERTEQLRVRNVASPQQLDSAVAALAQADADVASAKAGLASAQLNLQYADITAPISGRIGRALITEGALVAANGSEALATIQQLDPVYADFTQSATDLIRLRRAVQAGALSAGNPTDEARVRLFMDDGSAYPHPGRLLFSEATVDAGTGQVTLRGEFPNPNGDLLPGMYVRVLIEQGVQQNAIAVPQQAIQRDTAGRAQLYIVKTDDTVELRVVRTSRVVGTRAVIDDGLAAGDRVVVEGFQRLRPGGKVTAQPWTPSGPTAAAPSGSGR
ncbi:efflux RND transporter periplasmic adaptor subunit [Phreatobacter aquaticus]|uniref:Efflux RND transporter periplasmic adaptor subunit n=1 Tax=Phreatobacter aquaticus TaxID=2570229 RepID=A0A4D7QN43_9HYPH|nr:efflux RND transporter periplasmic adaptor subunit [Phreatobacter aquaticus]QCK88755.1 efflux RND transporter periplasmic adaptor subunit [Phreatobacter aquaticus]